MDRQQKYVSNHATEVFLKGVACFLDAAEQDRVLDADKSMTAGSPSDFYRGYRFYPTVPSVNRVIADQA
jgi:hypothetical protein